MNKLIQAYSQTKGDGKMIKVEKVSVPFTTIVEKEVVRYTCDNCNESVVTEDAESIIPPECYNWSNVYTYKVVNNSLQRDDLCLCPECTIALLGEVLNKLP